MRAGLTLLFILMMMIFPVNAAVDNIDLGVTKQFNFTVTQPGWAVVSVYLNDITPNSEQTVVLDSFSGTYRVDIKSIVEYNGLWLRFIVNVTLPNGTVVTGEKGVLFSRPDYDVKIQYNWIELDAPIVDVDIIVAFNPVKIDVVDTSPYFPTYLNWDEGYSFVPFYHVTGVSTSDMRVKLWIADQEGINVLNNGSILDKIKQQLSDAGKRASEWTWEQILKAISKIPVVGENFATALEVMGRIVGETFFFVRLILIENWELTVLTYESFAMMYAMQSRNIMTMYRRFVGFHVETVKLLFVIIVELINLLMRLIQAVGSLIPFT